MTTKLLTLSIIYALTSVLSAIKLSSEPITYSFRVPLIHRDALNFSSHDPKLSNYDRIKSAITRSFIRAELLFTNTINRNANLTEIILSKGEYFINISIGTPSFPFLAMIDTCSEDNWLECKFCKDCNEQKPPLFDPIKSSTFEPTLLPSDPIYNIHDLYDFYSPKQELEFQETIAAESSKFPRLSFDCKFTNKGTFSSIGFGVIGLQINNEQSNDVTSLQDSIDGKFSYCLAPLATNDSKNSIISFGEYADMASNDVVSTPMVIDGNVTKSVKLTLEAITIGEKRIEWNTKPTVGNIVIDIGTSLLMLQSVFYNAVESEISNQVNATKVDDPLNQLKLCYKSDEFKAPKVFMNFKGANVELNDYNVWVATSDSVICFAAAPANITIYENLVQRNFLIGHDRKKSIVYFGSSKCM